ncbi:hypothetical protein [Tsukamurella hominis]|uniref:hypothetical protein n=1 Tax=Tsukamurella hominis TaxID=1970232 RepID=UPI0039EBC8A7
MAEGAPFPVPRRFVAVAERRRRRETVAEQRIRREAPTPEDAAAALLQVWRHPDRFLSLARGVRIERAFRGRHPRLEFMTAAGAVITPMTLDAPIPAGASDAYLIAAQLGTVGLVSWTTVTLFCSGLALSRMATRRELPGTYALAREWADADALDPEMAAATLALTTEYVRLRNEADGLSGAYAIGEATRTELRRLALITRKHAAAIAAESAALASGDDSTAIVPATLGADLAEEFTAQSQRAGEAVATLRSSTASAIAGAKMRVLRLPEPTGK